MIDPMAAAPAWSCSSSRCGVPLPPRAPNGETTCVASPANSSGDSYRAITERTVNMAGTTTWTNTAANNGGIRTGGAAVAPAPEKK